MPELVLNSPVLSCCGHPRAECRCAPAPVVNPYPFLPTMNDEDDVLPLPRTTYGPVGKADEGTADEEEGGYGFARRNASDDTLSLPGRDATSNALANHDEDDILPLPRMSYPPPGRTH